MYDIEDKIPMPAREQSGGRRSTYPFSKLALNQSFLVPYDDLDDDSIRRVNARVRRAMTTANRANKKDSTQPKFSARAVETGIRVWRVV